jgi:hypothetical protein
MTTFAHRSSPATRPARMRLQAAPKKYDIRVVDQFYAYCQAIARTERHRDEARNRSHQATKRALWTLLIAGGFLFYYLVERLAQAMSLY